MRRLERIAVHHTGGNPEATVEQVRHQHVVENGWSDIGYQYLVDPRGRRFAGRPIDRVPAANGKGRNAGTIAVAGFGDNTVPGWEWTQEQKGGIVRLCRSLQLVFPTLTEIVGHRTLKATLCPGMTEEELEEMFRWIEANESP